MHTPGSSNSVDATGLPVEVLSSEGKKGNFSSAAAGARRGRDQQGDGEDACRLHGVSFRVPEMALPGQRAGHRDGVAVRGES